MLGHTIAQIPLLPSLLNSGALLSITPIQLKTGVAASMYPYFILAVLIDASIAALWYMAGVLLNNNGVKAGARGEMLQVFGTAIIAGIILSTFLAYGTIYYNSVLGQTGVGTVLSPADVYQTCVNLGYVSGSALSLTPVSFAFVTQSISTQFLSASQGSSPIGTPNPSLCGIVDNVATYGGTGPGDDGTTLIDYPLAATGIVTANLTNQVGTALSQLFVLDAYVKFLYLFKPTFAVCYGIQPALSCASAPFPGALPLPFTKAPTLFVQWSFLPLAGLELVQKSYSPLSALLYTALAAFIPQLLSINFFMYAWPWLMFIGLVFRGVFFLRKIGGLFIAVAIGAILVYPTLFSIEYLTASNPTLYPASLSAPVQFCGSYQYYPNFFVLPSVQAIGTSCGCWPTASGGLLDSEAQFTSQFTGYVTATGYSGNIYNVVPLFWGYQSVQYLEQIFQSGGQSFLSLPANPDQFQAALDDVYSGYCHIGTYNAQTGQGTGGEGTAFALAQAYGIIGVTAYFIPLINIVMTLAAILGLSGLLGGDTQLAGLSKLI